MGASGWGYFVPYQADMQNALNDLRLRVFEKGEYYTPGAFLQMILDRLDSLSEEERQRYEQLKQEYEQAPKPKTIEELIRMNGEDGTHSILDMDGVSSEPEFGKVSPLTPEELHQVFGTSEPSRDMIEGNLSTLLTYRQRWEGLYIVVYKDGSPHELLFAGYSGD